MTGELLASIEREVLEWEGVFKKRDEDGPSGTGVTGYRYGRSRRDPTKAGPQIGHVHDDGHADFSFPKEVWGALIESGRATPHPAFPDSRTTVSHEIRTPEDVPRTLELFRMNYERLKESARTRLE